MIESADDDAAVGQVGEVSRFQIKPWIWRLYSQSVDYQNAVIASYVAERHLASLEQNFRKRARREPTDFDLYVLWNAGPTYYNRIGFSSARVHPIIRDRAQRYANLREAKNLQPQPILVQASPPHLDLKTNRVSFPLASPTAFQPRPQGSAIEPVRQQGMLAVGGIPAK